MGINSKGQRQIKLPTCRTTTFTSTSHVAETKCRVTCKIQGQTHQKTRYKAESKLYNIRTNTLQEMEKKPSWDQKVDDW